MHPSIILSKCFPISPGISTRFFLRFPSILTTIILHILNDILAQRPKIMLWKSGVLLLSLFWICLRFSPPYPQHFSAGYLGHPLCFCFQYSSGVLLTFPLKTVGLSSSYLPNVLHILREIFPLFPALRVCFWEVSSSYCMCGFGVSSVFSLHWHVVVTTPSSPALRVIQVIFSCVFRVFYVW